MIWEDLVNPNYADTAFLIVVSIGLTIGWVVKWRHQSRDRAAISKLIWLLWSFTIGLWILTIFDGRWMIAGSVVILIAIAMRSGYVSHRKTSRSNNGRDRLTL